MSGRLGPVLMVQGTASHVGKTTLVAAICRILRQDGLRVAPFKAQNMALNSYVAVEGGEIGRAQALQAEAAGVEASIDMNPILLKPEADARSQVIVAGRSVGSMHAVEYQRRKAELWPIVTAALDRLRASYDIVLAEGAGSPAEINLKQSDLSNMRIAQHADAPVLLVGDIDRGGVFASLLGTLELLDPPERARVRGLAINKFRGDPSILAPGLDMLRDRTGVPVLGVLPFLRDLDLPEEDSLSLDGVPSSPAPLSLHERWGPSAARGAALPRGRIAPPPPHWDPGPAGIPVARVPHVTRERGSPHDTTDPSFVDVAVVRLPRIANFDDFDPLRAEPDVRVRYVERAGDLGRPDLAIIPGTKTTMADLIWLRERGLADRLVELAGAGVPIVGICGGFQMLGRRIDDPDASESVVASIEGLGLLPVITTFEPVKRTVRIKGRLLPTAGPLEAAAGSPISAYEIHMGRSRVDRSVQPLVRIERRSEEPVDELDGAMSPDGLIVGTYLHGLFDNDPLRHALIDWLMARRRGGMPRYAHVERHQSATERSRQLDRLADVVRQNLDLRPLLAACGIA